MFSQKFWEVVFVLALFTILVVVPAMMYFDASGESIFAAGIIGAFALYSAHPMITNEVFEELMAEEDRETALHPRRRVRASSYGIVVFYLRR